MEEFEIHGEDEVEVVPMSPLRRLEKRLEAIEKSSLSSPSQSNYFVKEMLETMKSSQKLVDDIVIANHKLVEELSKTNSRLAELVDLIRSAGETEVSGVSADTFKPMVDKLDKLIESNENLSITLEESMKKSKPTSSSLPTKIKLPYPPHIKNK